MHSREGTRTAIATDHARLNNVCITTCQRLHTFKHVHTAITHDLSRPIPSYLGPSYDLPWPTHDLHCLHYESLLMGVYIRHLLRPITLFSDRQFFTSPASTKLKARYTGSPLSFCPYVDRTVSALYPHLIKQLQKVCRVWRLFQNLKFWQILKICNFDFVVFWLGIQYDLIVWFNHEVAGGILRTQAFYLF